MPRKKERTKLVGIILFAILLIGMAAALLYLLWKMNASELQASGQDISAKKVQEWEEQEPQEDLVWNVKGFSVARQERAGEKVLDESDVSNQDYIFPDSDSLYLTKKDLKGLTKEELSYARNEIYARHGRTFQTESLQAYFESKSWYEPLFTEDEFPEDQLNQYEKKNAKLIREYEKEMGY